MARGNLRIKVTTYYPENDITACINTLLDLFTKYKLLIEVERE